MGMSKRFDPGVGVRAAQVILALLFVAGAVAPARAQSYVAGTQPDRRPEGAPRVQAFEKSPKWQKAATAGVARPIPPSLKFLDDQGAWFTPFTRPGMPGRYDIRKLHRN